MIYKVEELYVQVQNELMMVNTKECSPSLVHEYYSFFMRSWSNHLIITLESRYGARTHDL